MASDRRAWQMANALGLGCRQGQAGGGLSGSWPPHGLGCVRHRRAARFGLQQRVDDISCLADEWRPAATNPNSVRTLAIDRSERGLDRACGLGPPMAFGTSCFVGVILIRLHPPPRAGEVKGPCLSGHCLLSISYQLSDAQMPACCMPAWAMHGLQ
jgi:hypothetical protein